MKTSIIQNLILSLSLMIGMESTSAQENTVVIKVDPEKVIGKIDENIYGQLVDQIYHSVNGGLWGEIVWNRSFEETLTNDIWRIENGIIISPSSEQETRMILGDGSWRDYEFSLEASKIQGSDGFFVGVRGSNGPFIGPRIEREGYTLAFGANNNKRLNLDGSVFNRQTKKFETKPLQSAPNKLQMDRWYHIRVRCEGKHIQTWLDDSLVIDLNDAIGSMAGWVTIGTRNSNALFRHLKVTSLTGKSMFDALPTPARHWIVLGTGEVRLDTINPLNSSNCLKIKSTSDETGVQQNGLVIKKSELFKSVIVIADVDPF